MKHWRKRTIEEKIIYVCLVFLWLYAFKSIWEYYHA